MKVLMYSSTGRDIIGGAQVAFAQLADGLERCGHGVVRAYREPDPASHGPDWVFPLTSLSFVGYRATLRKVPAMLLSLWRLARGLYRIRPDVVNVHYVGAGAVYFLLLRRVFGFRLVLSFHGSDAFFASGHNLTFLPYLIRRADAVTAVSGRLGEAVQALAAPGQAPLRVIPNGVPLGFWTPSPVQVKRPHSVVTVGRLVRVKGHDLLVSTMVHLRQVFPDATLTIVGEGPERSKLEAEAERAGLGSAITFMGEQPADVVRDQLRQACVFVLPSRNEGFGLALVEAMACGLPAVATAVGGVPGILTPEAGVLVAPEEPEMFANALAALLKEPSQAAAMGRAAQARAQEYSSSRVVDAFDQLFQTVQQEPYPFSRASSLSPESG